MCAEKKAKLEKNMNYFNHIEDKTEEIGQMVSHIFCRGEFRFIDKP